MKIKLYNKSKHYFEIITAKHYSVLLIPSFLKPIYRNVKKEYGDNWSDKYIKWYFEFTMRWLFWKFELKIAN